MIVKQNRRSYFNNTTPGTCQKDNKKAGTHQILEANPMPDDWPLIIDLLEGQVMIVHM